MQHPHPTEALNRVRLLVIGQEQDEPGGRFSAAESFHGRITRLDIWSRALPPQQLRELKTQCDYYFGDLLGWPDVYTGLRGEIKVSQSVSSD